MIVEYIASSQGYTQLQELRMMLRKRQETRWRDRLTGTDELQWNSFVKECFERTQLADIQ